MKVKTLLTVIILSISYHLSAQWSSFITNYHREEFGRGSQTWDIDCYDDNWSYFANRNGIIQFNRKEWHLFPMKNHTEARSVYISRTQQRLYVGGINELGYYQVTKQGEMRYNCLSDSFPEFTMIGNIWAIHQIDNTIYASGDGLLIKYLDNRLTRIESPAKIGCSNIINNNLLVGTDKALYMLAGDRLIEVPGSEKIRGKRLRSLLPYKDGFLIVTAYEGIYYCNFSNTERFATNADQFMLKNEVFCATISKNLLALGTISKGVAIINLDDSSCRYMNENNGLKNNTVLSLDFDPEQNLWAGLDNGIDYIMLDYPITNLPCYHGSGYTALLSKGRLYLGTNRGLFYTEYPVRMDENPLQIKQVAASSGQVWNLKQIGDDIFCLHDRGLFIVEDERIRRIGNFAGVWSMIQLADNPDKMLMGTYSELYVMEKIKGHWQVSGQISNFYEAVYNIEQESADIFWIHTATKGVIRLKIDFSTFKALAIDYYGTEKGLPCNNDVYVNRINNKIYFTTPAGIYHYNMNNDRIEPDTAFNSQLGVNSYARIQQKGDRLIGLSDKEIFTSKINNEIITDITHTQFDNRFIEPVKTLEAIVPVNDSLIILPNDFGFAILHIKSDYKKESSQHLINKVFITSPKDSLIYSCNYLNRSYIPQIKYSNSAIRIEYGALSQPCRYQYRLSSDNEWSDFTSALSKEYNNLKEGTYRFSVRKITNNGEIKQDSFDFEILNPWYRSVWAYIIYVIIFILLIRIIYIWDDMRMKRKKNQVAKEKDAQMQEQALAYQKENERKEKQITALEKEKLEHDLQHKSQEMANLLMNFARKNEVLIEIKQQLLRINTSLKGDNRNEARQMLLMANNMIDTNIQTDDIFNKIEEQFDLIHNNFMKEMQALHPDLTRNERMMCAYLKMGLSSKEIAPLFNISVRGVETLRYRLRKKLGLERDSSLMEYLNKKQ